MTCKTFIFPSVNFLLEQKVHELNSRIGVDDPQFYCLQYNKIVHRRVSKNLLKSTQNYTKSIFSIYQKTYCLKVRPWFSSLVPEPYTCMGILLSVCLLIEKPATNCYDRPSS